MIDQDHGTGYQIEQGKDAMVFAITRLTNEQIVIVTIDLPLDRHLDRFRSISEQLNHLAASVDEPLYIIFDIRGQDISFSDILIGLDEVGSDPASWIKHPHVVTVGIGTHPMLRVAVKRVLQQLRIQTQTYPTIEEALTTIRTEIIDDTASGDP